MPQRTKAQLEADIKQAKKELEALNHLDSSFVSITEAFRRLYPSASVEPREARQEYNKFLDKLREMHGDGAKPVSRGRNLRVQPKDPREEDDAETKAIVDGFAEEEPGPELEPGSSDSVASW